LSTAAKVSTLPAENGVKMCSTPLGATSSSSSRSIYMRCVYRLSLGRMVLAGAALRFSPSRQNLVHWFGSNTQFL
jgi:hypothetical protein